MAETIYISHGGGPLPILGEESHGPMVDFMKRLSGKLKRPDAILVVSAHWEEADVTLTAHPAPELFFDYYGFPSEAYEISYPAPGNPDLAERAVSLIREAGISARLDQNRGFDHGVFIPLKLIYPDAEIPVIQLSLLSSLDPSAHIALGKALSPLKEENILIIGSGFSFHNMRAFSMEGGRDTDVENDRFHDWLIGVCVEEGDAGSREKRLSEWENAPGARYCHPREEHLLPLHFCAGFTGKRAATVFDDYILGKRAIGFFWT